MAETGVSPKSSNTGRVDINDLLDQDEQDIRSSFNKDQVVDSGNKESGNTSEEESENDDTDEDSEGLQPRKKLGISIMP